MRKKRKVNQTSGKKPIKKKVVKKARASTAPKTRNNFTMTESAFWSFIRSALRQKSRWWKPILAVKNDAKIDYVGPNKRRKFSYICSECKGEFDSKQVKVHHIEECGSLTCGDDLKGFIERLFCEKEGLQLLCDGCHDAKHIKIKKTNGKT